MVYDNLKSLLDQYNWDEGFETPKKILSNPNCDLALALEIFYLADGFAYLAGLAEESRRKEWTGFIDSLYHDIAGGKYTIGNGQYKIPLTKVQKYKFMKKQIPEVFLTDL